MKLSTLLEALIPNFSFPDIEISGLALDSRYLKPGDLFFAYPGEKVDGRHYIPDAIEKGAAAILCEAADAPVFDLKLYPDITVIYLPDLRHLVGDIAAKFYDFPSEKLFVIGVTGTNGKTSTCQLIAEASEMLSQKAATIGTIGYGVVGAKKTELPNTTPDPISLQKIFADFQKRGVKVVAMEVSSHALDQGRVQGIEFKMGIFTNLTRDHLDYHQTMDAYRDAKRLLFQMPGMKYGIFNLDDPVGFSFIEDFKKRLTVCGYGTDSASLQSMTKSCSETCRSNSEAKEDRADYPVVLANDVQLNAQGITAHVHVFNPPNKDSFVYRFNSRLLGRFNLSNLLAALCALKFLGHGTEKAISALSQAHTVPGRMQAYGGNDEQPLFVIDYAHTPDALEKALLALREHCEGRLFCVFGCGGDRDRGKRPMMAKTAEQFSDVVILTNDNVRTEDPEQIFNDTKAGFQFPNRVHNEHDREEAIRLAYSLANPGDIILLAGKGHENYQVIGTEKLYFSEKEIVEKILGLKTS